MLDVIALGRKDHPCGGFFNYALRKEYFMKTTIYIDGFNLYYGALKNTPYKWLDIFTLFSEILSIQNPKSEIDTIKFFTAPVKAQVATNGQKAFQSQNDYHRALKKLYPEKIQIIEGYFSLERANLPAYKKPIDKQEKLAVWKLEEKQTDVNISLHIYDDVVRKKAEQVVLVSNDSDLLPSLEFSKEMNPEIVIGTIIPRLQEEASLQRPPNSKLSKFSDWTRSSILENELQKHQMPAQIPTKRKPILRPDYW